ncbi:MAG: dihydroorotase [Nitrososphaerota archaeon]
MKNPDCEIVGATLVTPSGRQQGVLAIRAGRIVGLLDEPTGTATRVIDATGLLALPGMVDEHVHFMDPGDTTREDFQHGSGAAALGGVTTVIEHTHGAPVLNVADLHAKIAHLEHRSLIDFGLIAHVFPETIEQVPALWAAGVAIFKAFTCTTHGVPALLSDDLLRLFQLLAAYDARVLVHCEDEFITQDTEQRLRADQRDDYGVIVDWRVPEAEMVAVNMVALLARITGAQVTIAHVSQPAVVDLVEREREQGARLTIESCPQYFYLDADAVRCHGPTRKFTPPAREQPLPRMLWERLRRGQIDIIATDHAPSTLDQKHEGDIWSCHFGLPGVETTLPLLLTAAHEGQLALEDIVRVYSETPARLWGVYPRKGALRVGSDADIVLVDPEASYTLRNEAIYSKAGWTPYDGMRVTGQPMMTMVRGTVVAERGKITAEPGIGRFTRRA